MSIGQEKTFTLRVCSQVITIVTDETQYPVIEACAELLTNYVDLQVQGDKRARRNDAQTLALTGIRLCDQLINSDSNARELQIRVADLEAQLAREKKDSLAFRTTMSHWLQRVSQKLSQAPALPPELQNDSEASPSIPIDPAPEDTDAGEVSENLDEAPPNELFTGEATSGSPTSG